MIRKGTNTHCCGRCKYGTCEDADGWLMCTVIGQEVFCGEVCDEHYNEKEQ